jgi:hypothetical protein
MKEFCQSASEPFCSDFAHTLVSQKAQRPTKLKKLLIDLKLFVVGPILHDRSINALTSEGVLYLINSSQGGI